MRRALAMVAGLAAGSLVGLLFTIDASGSSSSQGSTAAQQSGVKYSSTLGVAAEIPKPKRASANAGGTFALTLTRAGSTYAVTWKLTFYKLTGKAVAAHIHAGPPYATGPAVLAPCG